MSFEEKIRSIVWAGFEEENEFPAKRPLLAHYTSVAVLDLMMSNDEIWFSHPLYMNDLEELRFGMIEGANVFRGSAELRAAFEEEHLYMQLIAHFNYLFNEFDEKHVFDTYVMCLANHDPEDTDGLLSMWRGYGAGGSGVAIVFDTAKINASEDSPFIIGPVRYATTADRLGWMDVKMKAVAELLVGTCSGLMKPDTHLGENARQNEVSDDQTTPYLFP